MNSEAFDLITAQRHLISLQRKFKGSTGNFTLLLSSVILSCKYISKSVSKAGLAGLTGLAGGSNTSGDDQKKLDVLSNDVMVNALASSGVVSVMVSEEEEQTHFVANHPNGEYCVVFDPLDGSSNIDCGVNVGTIFGVYKRLSDCASPPSDADVLRSGTELVAAGYCMYGSSTSLVWSFGAGVHAYTLDTTIGEFILTHEDIKIKPRGKIYSVNEGNSVYWNEQTRKYVELCKNPPKESGRKPYSLRYVGSMVADVHRTLLYGGVFMYPGDSKSPKGKLRVLYEALPMAFLVEQAGGKATTGESRLLEVCPTSIHERSPVFLGSSDDIDDLLAFK